jgi:hypothetical protein
MIDVNRAAMGRLPTASTLPPGIRSFQTGGLAGSEAGPRSKTSSLEALRIVGKGRAKMTCHVKLRSS